MLDNDRRMRRRRRQLETDIQRHYEYVIFTNISDGTFVTVGATRKWRPIGSYRIGPVLTWPSGWLNGVYGDNILSEKPRRKCGRKRMKKNK